MASCGTRLEEHLEGRFDDRYLLLDASNDPITGVLKIDPSILSTGESALVVNPTNFVFGASKKDIRDFWCLSLDIDANNRSSDDYGKVNGLSVVVDNDVAAVQKAFPQYGVKVDLSAYPVDGSLYAAYSTLVVNSATYGSGAWLGLYASATGNNWSTGISGGLEGCRFEATNGDTTGDTHGSAGYAANFSGSGTGEVVGLLGIFENTGSEIGKAVQGAIGSFGATNKGYAFYAGGGMCKFGPTWVTSVTDLSSSNPSTHLTPHISASYDLYVEDDFEVDGTAFLDGTLQHGGTTLGFYGVTPIARSSTYSPTNVVTDRAYDADSTTTAELADVLGTLIADLKATGIIG